MDMVRKSVIALTVLVLLTGLWGGLAAAAAAEGQAVIRFTDAALEAKIRTSMGRPDGDITVEEAGKVESLSLSNENKEGLPPEELITDISDLRYFPNLFSLDAVNNDIADIGPLADMQGLKYLDLGGNAITDVSPLSRCTEMQSLGLWGNKIADISPLAALQNLTWLYLNDNEIADFSPIAGMTRLTALTLRFNATQNYDALAALYPGLTEEKDFEILTTPFDPAEILVMEDPVLERKLREAMGMPEGDITAGDAKNVTELELGNPWGTDPSDADKITDIAPLRYFVNLRYLNLQRNGIHDVSALAGLTALEELRLEEDDIFDFSPLAGLVNLKTLYMSSYTRDVSFLSNQTKLENLNIGGCRALPEGLANLTELRSFEANGGELSDISLLANLKHLDKVGIAWNLVEDLSPLEGLPITRLYLQGNPIKDYSPIKAIYPNLVEKDFVALFPEDVPEEPLAFADTNFEEALRNAMNIHDRPITTRDAYVTTKLDIVREKDPTKGFSDISPLAAFTNLEELSFNSSDISDLTPLAKLVNLRHLNLSFQQITDIGPLASLTKLTGLSLRNNRIVDIAPLANLKELSWLEMAENLIVDVSPLSGLTSLRSLYLMGNPIGSYAPLDAILPGLENTDVVIVPGDIPDEAIVFPDANLEAAIRRAVSFGDGPISQRDAYRVSEMVLDGGQNGDVRFSSLEGLQFFQGLKKLEIHCQSVTDLTPLAGLTQLEELLIKETPVSDLTPLAGLTSLTRLHLVFDQVTDVRPLQSLTKLSNLELQGNQIEDVAPLAALGEMDYLDISENQITDYTPLTGLGKLKTLRLSGNPGYRYYVLKDLADRLDIKDFSAELPDGVKDEPIVFGDAKLEAAVRASLGVADGPISQLEAYYATRDLIIPDAGITDISALRYFRNVAGLNLDWNKIKDFSPLSALTKLRYLSLGGTGISDLSPLAGLTELDQIYLFDNGIKDVSPLLNLTKLKRLYLSNNPIGNLAVLKPLANQLEDKDFDPASGDRPEGLEKKPIAFKDKKLEKALRAILNIWDRDITEADVYNVLTLDFTTAEGGDQKFTNLSPLAYFVKLEELRMTGNGVKDIKPLAGLTRLRVLRLENQKIKDLAPLAGLTELKELSVKENSIVKLDALAGLTGLMSLDLTGNSVKDASPLAGLTSLEGLYLSNNAIADVTPIGQITNLRTLHIQNNKIKDPSPIANLTLLEGLMITGNKIKDYGSLSALYPQLQDTDLPKP